MDSTSHFPKDRNVTFRAKALASGIDPTCKFCGAIVKAVEKSFCSHKCYISHRFEGETILTSEDIMQRVQTLINVDEECLSLFERNDVLNKPGFIDTYNKIYNLKYDDLSAEFGFSYEGKNRAQMVKNKTNILLSYLVRLSSYQPDVEDLWGQIVKIELIENKNQTREYYEALYGVEEADTRMQKKSDRVKGENNPAYQHGGLYSPFSKKFINGDVREETIEKAKKGRENGLGYQSRLDYWTSRYGEEEGKRLYYERQCTFSREKLVEKHGQEEGERIWKERQESWQATLNELPEEEKIQINAKKGFWRYTSPKTDEMDFDPDKQTKLYVIRYQPVTDGDEYIKVGVTSKDYLSDRFKLITIKEEILIHEADRFTNFHIERDVKKYIFENNLSILIESEDQQFDGWTECVNIEHLDTIMDVVRDAIANNTK